MHVCFDHLLYSCAKYQYLTHGWESEKIYSHTFKAVWLQQSGLSKKRPKNVCFWFKFVLRFEHWPIKNIFLLIFFNVIWKDGPCLLWKTKSSSMCGQSSILYLDLRFHSSRKIKKRAFLPFKHFLMILKQMFNFCWHPPTPEIHTDVFFYKKGGVIKHIKAPVIVNMELTDLWEKNRTCDDVE